MTFTTPCSRWSLALLLLVSLLWPLGAQAKEPEYVLRYGDALTVTVVGHPELSVQAQPIRPDGQISLPLVPAVPSRGKTVSELTADLVKAYRPFLLQPQIAVTVAKFRPLRVTVLGQVTRPGTLEFEETPTLLEALASAGGLSEQALRSGIKVVSPTGTSQVYDLDRLLSHQGDVPKLEEGSVVEVAQVWGPDLYRVTIPLLAALISATVWLLRP
ncbi:Polysaccharide biosynthesis/export protein [compost metagenome]